MTDDNNVWKHNSADHIHQSGRDEAVAKISRNATGTHHSKSGTACLFQEGEGKRIQKSGNISEDTMETNTCIQDEQNEEGSHFLSYFSMII